jgi:hypothetical protein
MTKTKIQRSIISRIGGFIFLLAGFIISKHYNLFGWGEFTYVTIIVMTVCITIVDIIVNFIFKKIANRKSE